jgi:lipoate-protein ligase A
VTDPLALPTRWERGAVQMAFDEELLETAAEPCARRYLWSPPAVSLGKFQRLDEGAEAVAAAAGLDVVRRSTGGRSVLHGAGFEWSFAVVYPAGVFVGPAVDPPYVPVRDAFAAALRELGLSVEETRGAPYQRSALCFSSALRHDLTVAGEKVVAVAQARRAGAVLVHGSVLERRPPRELTDALAEMTGEAWRGEGLAAAGVETEGEALWRAVIGRLGAHPL